MLLHPLLRPARSRLARHVWRLALLILLLGGPGSAVLASAEGQRLCFPETGYCISGRVREYWERNGGLAVFGYPTTPRRSERNPDDGQLYPTQWFERNRIEWHQESAYPYDIQLGRLGADLLEIRNEPWQQIAPGEPTPGCLWFEETRHSVCDQAPGLGFRSYWQQHGLEDPAMDQYQRSLALFGLPLTDARLELNPTDGQRYITQWFERARFEWHPEKPDEYKVLLGLLGTQVQFANGVRYLWPTAVPQGMAVQPAGSGADDAGFVLELAQPGGGQFRATLRGGDRIAGAPRGQPVMIHGQAGQAFSTGAGYTLFWSERGWAYQLSSGLGLDDALTLAESLEPLSLPMWQERLAN